MQTNGHPGFMAKRPTALAAFLSLGFLCAPVAAHAEPLLSSTDYSITLAGIPIAKATFRTEITDQTYTILGRFNSSGVANLVTDITAQTVVAGQVQENRLDARSYKLVYRKGKKVETFDVQMRNGNVTRSEISPEPKRRPKEWVPVTEADLKSVFDPLSGLMIPADGPVCPRTVPVFDGESRMDLVLSPKGTQQFRKGDVDIEAIVCSVRYVPRAGYKKGRTDIEHLAKSTGMEIWFAKTDSLPLYAPVRARIPTRYGPVDVAAIKFDG